MECVLIWQVVVCGRIHEFLVVSVSGKTTPEVRIWMGSSPMGSDGGSAPLAAGSPPFCEESGWSRTFSGMFLEFRREKTRRVQPLVSRFELSHCRCAGWGTTTPVHRPLDPIPELTEISRTYAFYSWIAQKEEKTRSKSGPPLGSVPKSLNAY